jgi:hypothetical protein
MMRKRPGDVTRDDLLSPEPGEAREFDYLKANVEQLSRENVALRRSLDRVQRTLRPVLPLYRIVRHAMTAVRR